MSNELRPGWSYRKLDELGFVGRGRSRHRPRNDPSLYGGPYPFFQTGDVKAAELFLSDYSQTYNEKGLAQSKLWEPGTLCITIAANIAESAILTIRGCFPDSIVGFVADPNEADVHFVKYAIDTMKLRMQSISRGTTQDNLSLDKLLTFNFATPPLPTQRKIATVLSAYDDLIENNTRRIAILEEMAQALYSEWFVHFHFPGHQDVPLVDSPLGSIPEGWEVKRLEEMCDLVVGQSPKSEFYNDEGEGLPFHQGVKDFGDFFPTTRVYCTVTKRVAEAGDILFSVRAPVGRMNIADRRIVIGRGLHAIRSKTGNQTFTLWQLKEKFYEEDIMGGGTIFKSVTKGDMLGLQLLTPPASLLSQFEQIANPMLAAIKNLTVKNINLRCTRDLLLPRLIAGQLDVSHLHIDAGDLEDSIRSLS
jgi:type I restriction enzyme S subunit